ncbi:MAG: hypothetical protein BWX84_02010 [Verrucomicrobia bacterium ADurb.Bin118]|nr:MAG: hypothetical protein BWX84_02010 [Verrucomicrobia bacterium ADurb.Bin118]
MLPAMHQAWAETTGALASSRTMMVSPLSSVTSVVPAGMATSGAERVRPPLRDLRGREGLATDGGVRNGACAIQTANPPVGWAAERATETPR